MVPRPMRRSAKPVADRPPAMRPPTIEVPIPEELKRVYEPTRPVVSPVETMIYEVRDISNQPPESPTPARTARQAPADSARKGEAQDADITQLLRSPRGLRQAIILREIFAAPRSLRPMEDLPGTA
jgi:hypothetical protein